MKQNPTKKVNDLSDINKLFESNLPESAFPNTVYSGPKCCENCSNNPKNNPHASGVCCCSLPAMESVIY